MQGMLKAQESTLLADQKLVLGQKQKNCREFKKKKKAILVSCCYVFSACLLYPFPPILNLSYAVCNLFEMGTSSDVSVCICVLL